MVRNIVLFLGLILLGMLAQAFPYQGELLGQSLSSDDRQIEHLTRQGDQYFNRDEYDTALNYYEQALQKARQAKGTKDQCELLNDMAAVCMARGDLKNFQHLFALTKECIQSLEKPDTTSGTRSSPGNLLVNGGFEDGLNHPWGTGHYEADSGKTRFGIWWNSNHARAFMKIDTDERHSGKKSLRVTNNSPATPHVFTTTSQRISGLTPNTVYRVSLYAKARNLSPGVSFAVDAAWGKRVLSLPAGTYDWRHFSSTINIGHNNYIDLRLIQENTGTLWIDDLVVEPETEAGGIQASLQKAESLLDRARFKEALEIYRTLENQNPDNRGLMIQTRHYAGRIHLALGQYDEARRCFTWLADQSFRQASLDLGDLYYQLGEFDRAKEYYAKSLKIFEGDQGTYSLVQDKMAGIYLAQNKLDLALQAQSLSLRILRHIGDQHGQARALNTTGMIYLKLEDYPRALEALNEASRLAKQLDDQRLLADILDNRGEAARLSGHYELAAQDANAALTIHLAINDRRGRLQSLYLRGRLYRQTNQPIRALDDFRQAVALVNELYAQLGVTVRETRQAFLGQFADLYREYLDLLFELYQRDNKPEYKEAAFQAAEEARARVFTEMINEVRATHSFAVAAKDPGFARLLNREQEARMQLEAVRRQKALLLQAPVGQRDAKVMADLEGQLARATQQWQTTHGEITRNYPRYADLQNPQALTFKELQGLLRPDEAVISYFVTRHYTGVWGIDRGDVCLAVLPLGRQALVKRTRSLTEALPAVSLAMGAYLAATSPTEQAEARLKEALARYGPADAQALYQALVAPVDRVLQGKRLVFLAPDDLLYQVPFEALLTGPPGAASPVEARVTGAEWGGAPFWARSQSLSYLPSVSVLRSLRTLAKESPSAQKTLVAFADPLFEEGTPSRAKAGAATRGSRLRGLRDSGALPQGRLPRLPETAEEAESALRALGGAPEDLYLRERATEHNVKHLPLKQFRTMLFATHGLMAGEFRPGIQPALALSFIGDPDNDGLLEVSEILGLDLKANLVVLSACNTGRSSAPEDRGEGFAGMTRSFMYAGADSLVVTLWGVESQSAARLMGDFYAGLKTKTKASALSDAKRAMIGAAPTVSFNAHLQVSTAHPFFWAPYILVGEGQ
jgi:CHAT domain-containing protein/predicted negative regulator of RcsB-dependent stress response